jgi:two-component system, OmpR family, sensor kinase
MSLRTTLLIAFAYVLLLVIVMLEVPLVLNISRRVDAEVKAEASGQAQLVATTSADQLDQRSAMQRIVDRSARALGGRVIVVGRAGRVIVDSAGPGVRGVSYADRPEIRAALDGATAQGTRHSSSLGQDLLYTATPIIRNGEPVGAVRATQSVEAVHDEVRNDALALIAIGGGALLLGLVVAWVLARFLARPLGSLARTARRVGAGELDQRAPAGGPREQAEVAHAFNEMTDRLSTVLAAQREFVGNASHQLRTPLTGLRLRLEAAQARVRDPRAADDLRAAEEEVERLALLLNNLLTLAREGQSSPTPERISLAGAVRAAEERWASDAARRRQRLTVSGGRDGDVQVLASEDDLGIVLDNLVENAIRYSPPGGRVQLEWGIGDAIRPIADGARCGYVAVCDEGPGLAPGEEQRVVERFFRGKAGAAQAGTGLGLAIVEALARRWRGAVELQNRASGGLRAEVRLPLADLSRGRR